MGRYLEAYLSSMPAGQREAILRIVEQQKTAGMIATREQFDMELSKLIKALAGDGFDPNLQLEYPDTKNYTKVSSDMLNNNFQAIYVALAGLFLQMNRSDVTVQKHREVRKSDFDKVRAAINKLTEDIAIYRYLRFGSGDWTEAKYGSFWNRRNSNTSIKAADVDEQTKNARLRIGSSSRLHQLRGATPTTISVESLCVGQDGATSKSFEPENALDNSYNTFWAHLILADSVVQSELSSGNVQGASVRVTITLPNAVPVSTLSLVPFGSHPVAMRDLQYLDGDTWEDVVGFTQQDASLDWQSYGFMRVETNKLRFTLTQENYTKNTYLVPRRMFTNSLLWEQVLDDELMIGVDEEDLTGVQAAAAEANPGFRALYSGMKKFSKRLQESGLDLSSDAENKLMQTVDAITRVMAGVREDDAKIVLRAITGETAAKELSSEDLVEITKYEYLLGLRQVTVENRDYFPVGIWESPQYENQGTVYEVGLDTTERHVSNSDGVPQTSVEYELEVSPERRVSIVPNELSRIPQELLKVDPNTLKAPLRFTSHATPNMVLRRNGEVTTDWSHAGGTDELTITAGFNRNHIYTAAYNVAAGQDSFDIDSLFNSVELVHPEIFTNTDDNGLLTLSFYPYIAWEIVNNKQDWTKPDPEHARYEYRVGAGNTTIDGITYGDSAERSYEPISVLVNGVRARNITDYRGGNHPAFAEVPGEALVYQYIHVGKKLYFNRPVKGATIEVNYRWLTQYVRLIATLRGHQAVYNPYTPELVNYRLKMKTSRL